MGIMAQAILLWISSWTSPVVRSVNWSDVSFDLGCIRPCVRNGCECYTPGSVGGTVAGSEGRYCQVFAAYCIGRGTSKGRSVAFVDLVGTAIGDCGDERCRC